MTDDLYNNPRYYDIAFSWRDIPHEVDVFEESIRRYSKIPVRRMLELASGTSPHVEEIARRGYEYLGIDNNHAMINYAEAKAERLNSKASLILADMNHFVLKQPVDFVYIMLGSLSVKSNDDFLSHLKSVANALNRGGLYFLDWCVSFEWIGDLSREHDPWSVEKEGVKISVRYTTEVLDIAGQICRHRLLAEVNDHGRVLHPENVWVGRTIFPQEFLLLVDKSESFEFLGWWNHWNLDEPLEKATRISRPVVLLRRV